MEDLGPPIAYAALPEHAPVYDAAGERVGVVDHVLADAELDVFEGLIVRSHAHAGHHRFADASQVSDLHERGVRLSVGAEDLHEPTEGPATMAATPGDTAESELQARLRRAWDWISGRW